MSPFVGIDGLERTHMRSIAGVVGENGDKLWQESKGQGDAGLPLIPEGM